MSARDKAPVFDRDYFTLPSPAWLLALGTSIPFVLVTAYNPTLIPPALGIVRTASLYLSQNYGTFMRVWGGLIVVAHAVMAADAARRCSNAGMSGTANIKWTCSTFLFGTPSLGSKLKPYLEKVKKA